MQWISNQDQHRFTTSEFMIENPKAILLVIHGMAEHRDRYQEFAQWMNHNRYSVITLDLRGHKDSPYQGVRGYFGPQNGALHNVEDIAQVCSFVRTHYEVPLIVFGHSMGSLFSRSLGHHHPEAMDALILSGSPWKPAFLPMMRLFTRLLAVSGKTKPGHFLSKMLNRTFLAGVDDPQTDVDWLSFNRDNITRYLNDPDCNFPFTHQGYVDLMDLLHDVYNASWHAEKPGLPVLFIAGTHDPCHNPKANGFQKAIDNLKQRGMTTIRSIQYDRSRHELLNDDEKIQVMKDIADFLDETFDNF